MGGSLHTHPEKFFRGPSEAEVRILDIIADVGEELLIVFHALRQLCDVVRPGVVSSPVAVQIGFREVQCST